MSEDGRLKFSTNLDTSGLEEGAKKSKDAFKQIADEANRSGKRMSDEFDSAVKNLDANAGRLEKAFARAFDSAGEESIAGLKTTINEQVSFLKQLELKYKETSDTIKNLPFSPEKAALEKSLKSQKRNIDEEKAALDGLKMKYTEMTSNTLVSFRTELYNITNEMAAMRLSGEQNTEAYRELEHQLGKYATIQREIQTIRTADSRAGAELAGMVQGVQGLMGAYSAGSGIIGMFTRDQEKLMAVQTRMQSIMAILMGMQQLSNTLHSTSTFRLRTVTKIQQLYNGAVLRGSGALKAFGVSANTATVATHALYGALTLGLSVAIGAGIHLWNKYKNKQQEAIEKAKELIEVEKSGRAEMIKTRYELDNYITSIEEFNGTKEQEKVKVEELNKKYGESLGYYDSLADWYDVLIKKGEDYINVLFLQAKAQSLVNKAIEADEKVADIKAEDSGKVDGSMGWFQKMLLYSAQGESRGQIDARAIIKEHNEEAKKTAIEEAEATREAYLEEAKQLQKDIVEINEKYKIGGFIAPKTDTSTKSAPKDYTDQLEREKEERLRLQRDMEFAVRQAEIDMRNDGVEKTLSQNQLNYEKELEQIERQKKDKLAKIQAWERTIWESENPEWQDKGLKFTPTTTSLSSEDENQFIALEIKAMQNLKNVNEKTLNDLINEYGDYYEKRDLLARQWEEKIANLPDEYRANASAKMHKELADLDSEYLKTTTAISKLFEDTSQKSVQELRHIANEAERMKDFILGGEWDESSGALFGITQSQFETLNKEWTQSPQKLQAIQKAIRELHNEANQSENAFVKLQRGLKDVFNAGGDKAKLKNALLEVQVSIEEITDLSQDLGNNVATLFSAFGNDEAADMVSNITDLVGGVGQAGVGAAKLASGDIIGGVKDLAAGITNVVTSLVRIGDAKREKEIQKLQSQVDALKKTYETLSRAIDNAYSKDAQNLIKEQDKLLREQKRILNEQIRQEEKKKKTDKKRVQEYRDAIEEIDLILEENKSKAVEAIIGKDIKEAIDEFANAYINAWAAGEDRAASMKDVVRNMIRASVSELVKSRLSPEVKAFMDYLAKAMEDGILTSAEERTLDALEQQIYNKLQGFDSSLDKYIIDNKEEERTGVKRGIATASQESVDENNAIMTNIQAHTYSLMTGMTDLNRVSNLMLDRLVGIEDNTRNTNSKLDSIDKRIATTNSALSDIQITGVKIK